jgi:hypothetical protein
MRKGLWFGVLAALVLASALLADQGVVHLTDGTEVSGDIDNSDPNTVTITIHGARESLPRSSVDSIEYVGSIQEQFNGRMAKLSENDAAGRLEVARWAQGIGQYDLARQAAAEALAIDPTNPAALELLRIVNAQAALTTRQAIAGPAALIAAPPPPVIARRYLTLDQINQIRQLELKPVEGFAVKFEHDVRQQFLDLHLIDPQSFYALSAIDQAREILDKGEASMARDVRITSEPASLVDFRTRIGPMIQGGCTASGCHSAVTAAGGFALFTGSDSPQARYTNFYLLQTYRYKNRLMIDRNYPEKSLLAQYSLPTAMAVYPHPAVRDFHPMFPNRADERYQSLIYWMGQMLRPDAGTYSGIDYQPPWAATPQPTTAP